MQERVGGWLGGLELSQDWVYMFFSFLFLPQVVLIGVSLHKKM